VAKASPAAAATVRKLLYPGASPGQAWHRGAAGGASALPPSIPRSLARSLACSRATSLAPNFDPRTCAGNPVVAGVNTQVAAALRQAYAGLGITAAQVGTYSAAPKAC
jgi:hypothetical protein